MGTVSSLSPTIAHSRNLFTRIGDAILAAIRKIIACVKAIFHRIAAFFSSKQPSSQDKPPALTSLFMQGVSPEIAASVAINDLRLADTPRPIDECVRVLTQIATETGIQADEILTCFDTYFPDFPKFKDGKEEPLYVDQGNEILFADAKDRVQGKILNFIKYKYTYASYDREVADLIELFVKGIVFELRNPEILLEKKRESLIALASAAEHCVPRRYEASFKIWRQLSNNAETIDEILLQYVQPTKESLFLNYYSLSSEPVQTLNYIRSQVGAEFGLNTDPLALRDPHIDLHNARSPENDYRHQTAEQFRETFQKIFTPANFMNEMRRNLNERIAQDPSFVTELSEFIDIRINEYCEAGLLTQQEVDALPEPYQFSPFGEDKKYAYQLTDEGIRFLLVEYNFLQNIHGENAHLIRLPATTEIDAPVLDSSHDLSLPKGTDLSRIAVQPQQNEIDFRLHLQDGNTISLEKGNFSGDVRKAIAHLQDFCNQNTVAIESFGRGYGELIINGKKHDITPYGIDLDMMLLFCGKDNP